MPGRGGIFENGVSKKKLRIELFKDLMKSKFESCNCSEKKVVAESSVVRSPFFLPHVKEVRGWNSLHEVVARANFDVSFIINFSLGVQIPAAKASAILLRPLASSHVRRGGM